MTNRLRKALRSLGAALVVAGALHGGVANANALSDAWNCAKDSGAIAST